MTSNLSTFFGLKQKSFINDLKRVINTALEQCQAEGKIKIFSGIAMVSHGDAASLIFEWGKAFWNKLGVSTFGQDFRQTNEEASVGFWRWPQ